MVSFINPFNAVNQTPPRLSESTGVLGFTQAPVFTASIFNSDPGISRGGAETTGVNSFSSSPSSSSGSGGGLNVLT